MVSILINHMDVIKPERQGSESSQVDEPECFHMPLCQAPNSMQTEVPLLWTSLYVSFQLAIDLYPL